MRISLITALVVFVLLGIDTAVGEQSVSKASLSKYHLTSKQLVNPIEAAHTAQDYRDLAGTAGIFRIIIHVRKIMSYSSNNKSRNRKREQFSRKPWRQAGIPGSRQLKE